MAIDDDGDTAQPKQSWAFVKGENIRANEDAILDRVEGQNGVLNARTPWSPPLSEETEYILFSPEFLEVLTGKFVELNESLTVQP